MGNLWDKHLMLCPLFSRIAIVAIALTVFAVALPTSAQPDSEAMLPERRVKAAFVYKFIGYVEWPEGSFQRADTPVTIAVIGDDQFAAELTQLATRPIDDRPVAVRRVRDTASMADVHILFVGRAENARLIQLIKALQPRPILIVTESDSALTQGSVINFIVTGGRVRFEISLEAAEKRGLRLSSRLLTVAQNVRPGTP